jgi:hypothetical protein
LDNLSPEEFGSSEGKAKIFAEVIGTTIKQTRINEEIQQDGGANPATV